MLSCHGSAGAVLLLSSSHGPTLTLVFCSSAAGQFDDAVHAAHALLAERDAAIAQLQASAAALEQVPSHESNR